MSEIPLLEPGRFEHVARSLDMMFLPRRSVVNKISVITEILKQGLLVPGPHAHGIAAFPI